MMHIFIVKESDDGDSVVEIEREEDWISISILYYIHQCNEN